jgi:gliding motility-associated-like protein
VQDNGTLIANFFEVIYDVSFDVSPEGVGIIEVQGDELTEYPQSLSLPGNVPIDIQSKPTEDFFEFSHWSTLSGVPVPDDVTENIEITFGGPDNVVAHFIELPNYPLTIDAKPRGAGWVRIPDSLIQNFPYQNQQLGNENMVIEAIERGKYAFSHWEVIFGVAMDYAESPTQNYYLGGPTHIVAHFEERIHDVFIPNSFTPNGDGVNDLLKVYANEIDLEDFKFSVSNRWGNELFYTTDINKGWNGSDQNGDHFVPPGQYTYFVRYVNTVTGEIIEKAGTVTLIR